MEAVSMGNGQLHSMGMAELANPLDCMHDAQAILIRERERVVIVWTIMQKGVML